MDDASCAGCIGTADFQEADPVTMTVTDPATQTQVAYLLEMRTSVTVYSNDTCEELLPFVCQETQGCRIFVEIEYKTLYAGGLKIESTTAAPGGTVVLKEDLGAASGWQTAYTRRDETDCGSTGHQHFIEIIATGTPTPSPNSTSVNIDFDCSDCKQISQGG
jgi:hypothetical protein